MNGQTYQVKGIISDAFTGETLIGASITNESNGTTSDFDGSYTLELPAGPNILEVSYVGFKTQSISIDLNQDTRLDVKLESSAILNEVVVTADIAIERETPVAFSNIPTIKIEEELAAQDIPMLLNSTPGAYATESGGGDGDARISIRGFDQRNIAVMLDGIPVNDMENGRVFWSNWFGLDLVTQTMQVQRGLGASKLSIPSVGGTINILTQGIDSKKGLRLRQEVGNNGYLRTTLGMTTGRTDSGWGVSLAGSYKQGDGWVDGNFTKGFFYYLRIDKQLGDHLISFSGFGAPQEHGQRSFSSEIGQVSTDYALSVGVPDYVNEELIIKNKGRRFNESWGMYNGEVFNARKNYYHKPQISLRHSWQASEKTFLSNVAYVSIGSGGGTTDDGVDIPRGEDDLLDIQGAIDNNQPTVFNPEGKSNTIIRASVNNHFWYGLLSTLNHSINDNLTVSGGLDARSYSGDHYREVYDLLGGTGYTTNNLQVGDKFDYFYTGTVNQAGTFGLLEYKSENWASFINLSAAYTKYGFENHFTDFTLDDVGVKTGTIKLGATYNLDENHGVFINTGWLSRAQQYRNVIITNFWTNDVDGQVANSYDNEDIKAVELGYNFKSPKFSLNLNSYYTVWANKPLDRLPTIAEDPEDSESNRIPVNIPGVDALHKGVELDFAYKPTDQLTFEGLVSVGDWKWTSGQTVMGVLPNGVPYMYQFDANGVHVGDAAQFQLGGLVRYEPIKRLYFKLKTTHFDNNYANFQPETLQGANSGRESWKLPSYMISSLHMGYGFKYNDEVPINLRFNVLNLFDATYLSDARNNDDFNSPSFKDFDAKSASAFFGQGRRWSFSIQANF
ncbi:MAG: TonB-dependent receptor [Bacteroidia bacterium]|nr:TonB-dependent receptor [Bacteroidia bacterium]